MNLLSPPNTKLSQRLFIGIFPGSIVYADRAHETHGDYERLTFLPYDTLRLDVKEGCLLELLAQITAQAASL